MSEAERMKRQYDAGWNAALAAVEEAVDHEQCAGNHGTGYCTGKLVDHNWIAHRIASLRKPEQPSAPEGER